MDTEPESLTVCEGEPPAAVSPLVQRTRQLLHRRMKVEITDGRVMIGNFHCLDKQGNLLLVNTVEQRIKKRPGSEEGEPELEQRNLGLVLIPAEHRVAAHLELSPVEGEDPKWLNPVEILKEGAQVIEPEMEAS
uniref:Sm domain-containing protein n=1 Tax=Pyramimonas obovata TaxID=1411642 RepID=A0A7S0WLP1_9CHLO|mmetsp:Transcript_29811/g.65146  ORF Transcript_29811/g.65146 Transcript_29811/m.65146 type:complete len:134 (+) Transcript_29811:309-710(+)